VTAAATAAEELAPSQARWFSENPGKAWAEKFFLLYSPIWMLGMGLVMGLGVTQRIGDPGFLLIGVSVCAPLFIVPAIFSREAREGVPWTESYWFKANLYIAIFNFIGNYFLSEYFVDVLGMTYNYPTIALNFDAELVGSGEQRVPVLMFLLTQAYFMTYHSSAVVVLRRLRTSRLPGMSHIGWWISVFVIGYCWAWAETRAMANPWISDQFSYKDMGRMLTYGSIFYACYFIPSFPIFFGIDEDEDTRWSLREICFAALAAGMIVFILLDFWTKLIGPL